MTSDRAIDEATAEQARIDDKLRKRILSGLAKIEALIAELEKPPVS